MWLCFDGGDQPDGIADWGPPDTVVVYQQDSDRLVRWDRTANASCSVARGLDKLQVLRSGDKDLEIRLTLKCRSATQTYILTARNP